MVGGTDRLGVLRRPCIDRPDEVDEPNLRQQRERCAVRQQVEVTAHHGQIVGLTHTVHQCCEALGLSLIGLGLAVVARWPETRRRPDVMGRRWVSSVSVLGRGVAVARADRVIVLVMTSAAPTVRCGPMVRGRAPGRRGRPDRRSGTRQPARACRRSGGTPARSRQDHRIEGASMTPAEFAEVACIVRESGQSFSLCEE